ncbi:GNAT family N-acetyltransferase [Sphingomonas sp. YL-JM2C]
MSASESGSLRIEKLDRVHAVEGFDCGKDALNRFLTRNALQSQQAGASNTYVALDRERVVGFYSLVVGEVAYAEAAERLKKGLARHPVPVMLLARLAVVSDYQGKRLGAGLLKDAMVRTLQAADLGGIRALIVHAKDDEACGFYERYGFEPSPTDAYHLFILLKDVRRTIE